MKRFLFLLLFGLLLAACAGNSGGLKEDLLGTWQNPDGFQIKFYRDGGGFIPGVPGKIPDSAFTYTIVDETHIQVVLQGQPYTIEVKIVDDVLTWKDSIGEVEYTRVKE